jgi:hypothetical protein
MIKQPLYYLINREVDYDPLVDSPAQALYRIYSRAGRNDKLTLVEENLLDGLPFSVWKC